MKKCLYKGRLVDPFNLKNFVHDIEEIAHSLSLQCRFMGHCIYHYSIAHHSYLLSNIIDGSTMQQLQALMHDSPEYLTGDIVRPDKTFRDNINEAVIQKHVFDQFGIKWPLYNKVKEYDDRLLATENKQLMQKPFECEFIPFDINIIYLTPKETEIKFLERFYKLMEEKENDDFSN